MSRYCCTNEPIFKVVYDGGSMGNDEIFVCVNHVNKHPFDKKIISKEFVK